MTASKEYVGAAGLEGSFPRWFFRNTFFSRANRATWGRHRSARFKLTLNPCLITRPVLCGTLPYISYYDIYPTGRQVLRACGNGTCSRAAGCSCSTELASFGCSQRPDRHLPYCARRTAKAIWCLSEDCPAREEGPNRACAGFCRLCEWNITVFRPTMLFSVHDPLFVASCL